MNTEENNKTQSQQSAPQSAQQNKPQSAPQSNTQGAPQSGQPGGPKKKSRLIIIIAIIVALAALAVIIAIGVTRGNEEPETVKVDTEEEATVYGDESLGIDPVVDEQLADYRNIALFGIDAKEADSSTGHRSAGMIVISINEKTDDVKMFSVYRDTYLQTDDGGTLDKVNHAYAYGGMNRSIKALNRNLDLNIREGISLTWEAVRDFVDAIGGVEVEVLDSEVSYVNGAIAEGEKLSGAGLQTLNGNQAVAYSRIRYDSAEGDHRRNERMQIVLKAAFDKVKTMKESQLVSILDDMLPKTDTNKSRNRMIDTLQDIMSMEISYNTCWPYDTSDWMHDSIYYGVPVTLQTNVSQLHSEFFGQTDYVPTQTVLDISSRIQSMTGYSQ